MTGLSLHPSAPPTVLVTSGTITTASFTAPNGALLVACYTAARGGTSSNGSCSDSGSLNWNEITTTGGVYGNDNDECVQMFWAVTTNRTARTVTAGVGATAPQKSLRVWVFVNAHATPIGDTSAAAAASLINDSNVVSTAAGSLTIGVGVEAYGVDFYAFSTPTTIVYSNNTNESIGHFRQTSRATATSQTQTVTSTAPDASGQSGDQAYALAEIVPSASVTDITHMDTALSAANASATSCPVTYPVGIQSGDALVLVVGTKPYTATINNPDSGVWTAQGTVTNGTTAPGTDTGSVKIATFTKIATGSESGNLTVSITSGNSSWAALMWFAKDSTSTWDFATDTSTATAATNWTTTFATSSSLLAANDVVVLTSVCSTDLAITNSANALAATGCTFDVMYPEGVSPIGGAVVTGQIRTTTGNQSGGNLNFAKVLTGPSSDNLTWSMTKSVSTNQSASTALVRLRAVAGAAAGGPPMATRRPLTNVDRPPRTSVYSR